MSDQVDEEEQLAQRFEVLIEKFRRLGVDRSMPGMGASIDQMEIVVIPGLRQHVFAAAELLETVRGWLTWLEGMLVAFEKRPGRPEERN